MDGWLSRAALTGFMGCLAVCFMATLGFGAVMAAVACARVWSQLILALTNMDAASLPLRLGQGCGEKSLFYVEC